MTKCFLLVLRGQKKYSNISIIHSLVADVLPGVKVLKTATKAKTAFQDNLTLAERCNIPFQIGGHNTVMSTYVSDAVDKPLLLGL